MSKNNDAAPLVTWALHPRDFHNDRLNNWFQSVPLV